MRQTPLLLLLLVLACWPLPSLAESLLLEGESYEFDNQAEIVRYQNPVGSMGQTKIYAQRLIYYKKQRRIEFFGNLTVNSPTVLVLAPRGFYDIEAKLFYLYDASLYDKQNSAFMTASEIRRISDTEYFATNATLTLCKPGAEIWQYTNSEIHYFSNDYAYGTHSRLSFYKVPIMYSPFIAWPTTDKRSTGFLATSLSVRNDPGDDPRRRYGTWLRVPFYWVIDEDQDATFTFDPISKRGVGLGVEYRYAFELGMMGVVDTWGIREDRWVRSTTAGEDPHPTRFKASLDHRQVIWESGMIFFHLQSQSDNEINREYFNSTRTYDVKNYGTVDVVFPLWNGSLGMGASQQENFLYQTVYDVNTDVNTHLNQQPYVSFQQRSEQVWGTPMSVNSRLRVVNYDRNYGWKGSFVKWDVQGEYPWRWDFLNLIPRVGGVMFYHNPLYTYGPSETQVGAFVENPSGFAYAVGNRELEMSLDSYRVFTNDLGQPVLRLNLRPKLVFTQVDDVDQSRSISLTPTDPAYTGNDQYFDSLGQPKTLFERPILAQRVATASLIGDLDVKQTQVSNVLHWEIQQKYNLGRLQDHSSYAGPQIGEEYQETSPGQIVMPLRLLVDVNPSDRFGAHLFYRIDQEERNLLEGEVSVNSSNGLGDTIGVAYRNNRKAYYSLDGSSFRAAAKTLTAAGTIKINEKVKVVTGANWNFGRNDLAFRYDPDVSRVEQALTHAKLGMIFRVDCYDFYIGYQEDLYSWIEGATTREERVKKVILSVDPISRGTGEGPLQTSFKLGGL